MRSEMTGKHSEKGITQSENTIERKAGFIIIDRNTGLNDGSAFLIKNGRINQNADNKRLDFCVILLINNPDHRCITTCSGL